MPESDSESSWSRDEPVPVDPMDMDTSDVQPHSPDGTGYALDEITISLATGRECHELTAAAGGSHSLAIR